MKRKVITILSILCIAALCVGTAVAISSSHKIKLNPDYVVGNTAGNLYNGGTFCEDDEYVYFSNAYDNGALYRMRPDESDMKKLVSTQVSSINSGGDYLYYYQQSIGSGEGFGYMFNATGIYRVSKKNPAKNTCLDKIYGSNVVLSGNSLYYNISAENGTFLMAKSTDGKSSQTILTNPILPACVDNNTLYYQNTKTDLHLMAVNTLTNQVFQVSSEDIYTLYGIDIHNNYALIRMDLTTGEKTTLDDTRTDMLNASPQYIYYQTSGDTPQFKRISKDGSYMEVIADGAYNTIQTTSKYVYFLKFAFLSTESLWMDQLISPLSMRHYRLLPNRINKNNMTGLVCIFHAEPVILFL